MAWLLGTVIYPLFKTLVLFLQMVKCGAIDGIYLILITSKFTSLGYLSKA